MKTITTILFLLILGLALGCTPGTEEGVTETISPAEPPPVTAAEGDTVPTQTIHIGEDRSPNEGGILTKEGAETDVPPPPRKGTSTQ